MEVYSLVLLTIFVNLKQYFGQETLTSDESTRQKISHPLVRFAKFTKNHPVNIDIAISDWARQNENTFTVGTVFGGVKQNSSGSPLENNIDTGNRGTKADNVASDEIKVHHSRGIDFVHDSTFPEGRRPVISGSILDNILNSKFSDLNRIAKMQRAISRKTPSPQTINKQISRSADLTLKQNTTVESNEVRGNFVNLNGNELRKSRLLNLNQEIDALLSGIENKNTGQDSSFRVKSISGQQMETSTVSDKPNELLGKSSSLRNKGTTDRTQTNISRKNNVTVQTTKKSTKFRENISQNKNENIQVQEQENNVNRNSDTIVQRTQGSVNLIDNSLSDLDNNTPVGDHSNVDGTSAKQENPITERSNANTLSTVFQSSSKHITNQNKNNKGPTVEKSVSDSIGSQRNRSTTFNENIDLAFIPEENAPHGRIPFLRNIDQLLANIPDNGKPHVLITLDSNFQIASIKQTDHVPIPSRLSTVASNTHTLANVSEKSDTQKDKENQLITQSVPSGSKQNQKPSVEEKQPQKESIKKENVTAKVPDDMSIKLNLEKLSNRNNVDHSLVSEPTENRNQFNNGNIRTDERTINTKTSDKVSNTNNRERENENINNNKHNNIKITQKNPKSNNQQQNLKQIDNTKNRPSNLDLPVASEKDIFPDVTSISIRNKNRKESPLNIKTSDRASNANRVIINNRVNRVINNNEHSVEFPAETSKGNNQQNSRRTDTNIITPSNFGPIVAGERQPNIFPGVTNIKLPPGHEIVPSPFTNDNPLLIGPVLIPESNIRMTKDGPMMMEGMIAIPVPDKPTNERQNTNSLDKKVNRGSTTNEVVKSGSSAVIADILQHVALLENKATSDMPNDQLTSVGQILALSAINAIRERALRLKKRTDLNPVDLSGKQANVYPQQIHEVDINRISNPFESVDLPIPAGIDQSNSFNNNNMENGPQILESKNKAAVDRSNQDVSEHEMRQLNLFNGNMLQNRRQIGNVEIIENRNQAASTDVNMPFPPALLKALNDHTFGNRDHIFENRNDKNINVGHLEVQRDSNLQPFEQSIKNALGVISRTKNRKANVNTPTGKEALQPTFTHSGRLQKQDQKISRTITTIRTGVETNSNNNIGRVSVLPSNASLKPASIERNVNTEIKHSIPVDRSSSQTDIKTNLSPNTKNFFELTSNIGENNNIANLMEPLLPPNAIAKSEALETILRTKAKAIDTSRFMPPSILTGGIDLSSASINTPSESTMDLNNLSPGPDDVIVYDFTSDSEFMNFLTRMNRGQPVERGQIQIASDVANGDVFFPTAEVISTTPVPNSDLSRTRNNISSNRRINSAIAQEKPNQNNHQVQQFQNSVTRKHSNVHNSGTNLSEAATEMDFILRQLVGTSGNTKTDSRSSVQTKPHINVIGGVFDQSIRTSVDNATPSERPSNFPRNSNIQFGRSSNTGTHSSRDSTSTSEILSLQKRIGFIRPTSGIGNSAHFNNGGRSSANNVDQSRAQISLNQTQEIFPSQSTQGRTQNFMSNIDQGNEITDTFQQTGPFGDLSILPERMGSGNRRQIPPSDIRKFRTSNTPTETTNSDTRGTLKSPQSSNINNIQDLSLPSQNFERNRGQIPSPDIGQFPTFFPTTESTVTVTQGTTQSSHSSSTSNRVNPSGNNLDLLDLTNFVEQPDSLQQGKDQNQSEPRSLVIQNRPMVLSQQRDNPSSNLNEHTTVPTLISSSSRQNSDMQPTNIPHNDFTNVFISETTQEHGNSHTVQPIEPNTGTVTFGNGPGPTTAIPEVPEVLATNSSQPSWKWISNQLFDIWSSIGSERSI